MANNKTLLTPSTHKPTPTTSVIIIQIEGAYAPATIRTYADGFAGFIRFCDFKKYPALHASPVALAEFIGI